MEWFEMGPFTVFDVETTGMSPVHCRIVEISAVRVNPDGGMSRCGSLIRPECPIPPALSRVHHITDEMVADAPTFAEYAETFLSFIEGSTLVAHNARFDLGFLQESLHRCGFPLWQGRTIDSIRLLKKTHAGLPSYSLQNLRRAFHLPDPFKDMQAHRAGADVEWTMQLLEIALKEVLMRSRDAGSL